MWRQRVSFLTIRMVLKHFLHSLVHLQKGRTDASVNQKLFMEIRDRYRDRIPVYTERSRDGNYVAFHQTP